TVRWTQVSGFHTTTSTNDSPKQWDSGNLSSIGGVFQVVFEASDGPGPFPYLCSFHPFTMMDTIFMAPQDSTVFNFILTSEQANTCEGTGSVAAGTGIAVLNADSSELHIRVEHSVVNPTDAHVHLGPPCVGGPVQFAFASSVNPIEGTWTISSTDVANLFAGELYVNVHSSEHPAGEIRGQIAEGACCLGMTGNIDYDPADIVDIGDLTRLIDFLFISLNPLDCPAEANTDGDDQGLVDIADLTRLIDYLFISNSPPAGCR
ncbi:MAG: CHRD domain-containing protein, partial [Candidatus Zixiibacteriota bacterium]